MDRLDPASATIPAAHCPNLRSDRLRPMAAPESLEIPPDGTG